ncbi:VPS10 domain-containing receptor SorCS1 [Thelohanellus kitauei]|uniref:VPS10 domain-containing receptor SorCS1 n=1 Tax=Thelohanellus kitauei TaxID=669202 RepID=A0A0C2MA05_THEKT|nr:VPS10 domain-containing receptor SorCS1 [Thelohanellus kitauei]
MDYIDIHGNYYIVAEDVYQQACLFMSYNKTPYFVTVMSGFSHENLDRTPIIIHPTLPDVILLNIHEFGDDFNTYISKNNGKTFDMIKYEDKSKGCNKGLCSAKLNFEGIHLVHDAFTREWIIKLTSIDDRFQYIVTFDAGETWRVVPFANYHVNILNGGGIIMSIDRTNNKMVYSFDEGKIYYHMPIFQKDDIIFSSMIIGTADNERLIIYGRNSNNTVLKITYVDFTTLFKKPCQHDDYSPWSFSRSRGNCYNGQEVVYWKKNVNAMCIDNRTATMKNSKTCPCYLQDFQW